MNPEEIMKQLADETKAHMESEGTGPFGAAIVLNGEIIAKGFNRVLNDKDPTAHGEVVAIRNAAKKIGLRFPENTVMYTTSQSCPMCVAAAMWAGVRKIYYGASCEFDAKIGLSDSHVYSYLRGNEDPEELNQIQIGNEYAEAMLEWFDVNRKTV